MQTTITFKVAEHIELFLKLQTMLSKTMYHIDNSGTVTGTKNGTSATLAVDAGDATLAFNGPPQHFVGHTVYKALCAL